MIAETPSVNEWRVTDTTVVPQRISGGIGGYEAGNKSTQPAVRRRRPRSSSAGTSSRPGSSTRTSSTRRSTSARARRSRRPDGRTTATGASISIIADPTLGRIYRVTRANFNSDRLTTQKYSAFFVQDTWRVGERLTINPGLRYEQQTLDGNVPDVDHAGRPAARRLLVCRATGRRASARSTTSLGNGKSKPVRQLRAASSRASRTTSPPARCRPTTASAAATTTTRG